MKQIETNRLILRQFELSDVSIMFKNWASNPNVTKYLTWPAHENVETTKTVIESWIEGYNDIDNPMLNWAILLKEHSCNSLKAPIE